MKKSVSAGFMAGFVVVFGYLFGLAIHDLIMVEKNQRLTRPTSSDDKADPVCEAKATGHDLSSSLKALEKQLEDNRKRDRAYYEWLCGEFALAGAEGRFHFFEFHAGGKLRLYVGADEILCIPGTVVGPKGFIRVKIPWVHPSQPNWST